MAMETIPLNNDGGEPTGDTMKVDRHLYLTEDRKCVVEEDDVKARWLWATPGMQVPLAEAERLGAVKADSEAESVENEKKRTPAQNKQRRPRENKSQKNETETPPAGEE